MAEEEELIDLSNSTSYRSYPSADYEKLFEQGNAVFLAIVAAGLIAHALIIYTTAKSKRLRSRTNIIVMNWIVFEMVANNVIYPLLRYVRLHEHSFLLHMISGNVLIMALLSALLCLNVLITDSAMTSNKPTFKEFLERFYAIQFTLYAIILFWKLYTLHDVYMELVLIFAYFLCWLTLAVRVLYRQCRRLVKWQAMHKSEELRLHLATFFLVGKVLVNSMGIVSVVYKSNVLMQLAQSWCLSGIYVIVLLIVKDINFKISLFEVLGLNVKNPNDVDTMITEDKDAEENFVETCIEN